MINIESVNWRIDGTLQNRWDALLRVVADVRIWVSGEIWYEEEEFCVVELGRALAGWLEASPENRGDFVYESMESDEPELIRFSRSGADSWKVSSPFQMYSELRCFTSSTIQEAAIGFLSQLRDNLPQRDRTLDLLCEDENNRHLFLYLECKPIG